LLPNLSIELFPPKDQVGEDKMWRAVNNLQNFNLNSISVTYGAGGSVRDRTIKIAKDLRLFINVPVTAHLTCVNSTKEQLSEIVDQYEQAGIENILALRGDPVGGPRSAWISTEGGFDHADQLIAFLAQRKKFRIGAAAFPDGHPASNGDFDKDLEVLLSKEEKGAQYVVTQFFFNIENFNNLVNSLKNRGSKLKVIAGVLPITNFKQLTRMAELGGTELPKYVLDRINSTTPTDEIEKIGVDLAITLCNSLISNGVDGLHFYTMNMSFATEKIITNLGYLKNNS
jgi:methylenetetrahydrofolate reductase (NADPH)